MQRFEKYIIATLRLETAMHIGVGKAHLPTDAPLRRTSDGNIFIPGRALGGVLRSTATLLAPRLKGVKKSCRLLTEDKKLFDDACYCSVCQLFGDIAPGMDDRIARANTAGATTETETTTEGKDKTAASRLWIEDAALETPDDQQNKQPETLIRDGVGISRSTGAAYKHAKFDHEILPAGSKFLLRIKWVEECYESDKKEKEKFEADRKVREQILAVALAEWQNGRAWLGGNKARGLGRFKLENIEMKEVKLGENDPEYLIEYLLEPQPALAKNKAWLPVEKDWIESLLPKNEQGEVRKNVQDAKHHSARNLITFTGELNFDSAFLSNDPMVAARSGFDHAPMLDRMRDQAGNPIISGASLRGALRSHAEKIALTIATQVALTQLKSSEYEDVRKEFLKMCPACDPLAQQQEHETLPLANCDSRWRKHKKDKEVLAEDELCLSCQLFGSARLGSRFLVEDALWAGDEPKADSWKAQDFLAIDRFTGDGLEGAKFDAAPLIRPRFKFRLHLSNAEAWEIGWLALVLRDLKDGLITVGFGAAKGYGRATLEKLEWQIGYIHESDLPLDGMAKMKADKASYAGLYRFISGKQGDNDDAWLAILDQGVEAFNTEIREFRMEKEEDKVPFDDDTWLKRDKKHEESLLALYHTEA